MACLRNRDERFPLNAAPSVLDFMKRFGPQSDKPAAGGGTAPEMTEAEYNEAFSGALYRMPGDPPGTVRRKTP